MRHKPSQLFKEAAMLHSLPILNPMELQQLIYESDSEYSAEFLERVQKEIQAKAGKKPAAKK